MTNIIRWDPFREVTDLRDAMDRVFYRRPVRPWRIFAWDAGERLFPLDLYETDDAVVVKASLPGVSPEDLEISVSGDTLTIKGEVKEEDEEKKPEYYRQERRSGAFQRSLTLPVEVDADSAEAVFENGELKLQLPKAAELRPKTIKVNTTGLVEGKSS